MHEWRELILLRLLFWLCDDTIPLRYLIIPTHKHTYTHMHKHAHTR